MVEEQIRQVTLQLFLLILKIASPLAALRLAYSGLKTLAGDQEEAPRAIRQVGLGLFLVFTAQTIAWLIESFARAVAVHKQGW